MYSIRCNSRIKSMKKTCKGKLKDKRAKDKIML